MTTRHTSILAMQANSVKQPPTTTSTGKVTARKEFFKSKSSEPVSAKLSDTNIRVASPSPQNSQNSSPFKRQLALSSPDTRRRMPSSYEDKDTVKDTVPKGPYGLELRGKPLQRDPRKAAYAEKNLGLIDAADQEEINKMFNREQHTSSQREALKAPKDTIQSDAIQSDLADLAKKDPKQFLDERFKQFAKTDPKKFLEWQAKQLGLDKPPPSPPSEKSKPLLGGFFKFKK